MTPDRPVSVLAIVDPRPRPGVRALLGRLGRGGFQLDVHGPQWQPEADGHDVILGASARPPGPALAESIAGRVRQGATLVTLAASAGAWAREPELAALIPWRVGGLTETAELLVRPAGPHPVTDRMDPEVPVEDRLELGEAGPAARPLLTAPWHFATRVVAFEAPAGAGRVLHLGLGWTDAACETPLVGRTLAAALRYGAGRLAERTFGVGLLGYGAIGREHADAAAAVAGLRLAAVCDRSPARLEAARELEVNLHPEPEGLLADPEVDIVVVGTPPASHADAVLAALAAGKHVVCEKPFALRVEEVERMTAAARGHVLTVYQSRRWDPDFVALREIVRGGEIGDPFYMESFIGGFSHPCDFWHSHQPISGGTIYDWGSHYFDWVLQVLGGRVTAVVANAQKRVWHDVTNSDHVRVDLDFASGAQASFLQSDIAAALKPKWYVLGTRGAVTGDWRLETIPSRSWTGALEEEELAPADSPAELTIHRPARSSRPGEERPRLRPRQEHGFYRNLADHLLLGEPLAVPPGEAARTVAIMEAATRSIAAGGRKLKVRI